MLLANTLKDQVSLFKSQNKRKQLLIGTALVVFLGVLCWSVWYFVSSSRVSTDNAYTEAETAEVTALIDAPVKDVLVHDTNRVKAGDILVYLDDSDAKLVYENAKAQYERTLRNVRQIFINNRVLQERLTTNEARVIASEADVKRTQAVLNRAVLDLKRQQQLFKVNATSKEQLDHARAEYAVALAAEHQAKALLNAALSSKAEAIEELKANEALTEGVSPEKHPELLATKAQLDKAQLDLDRTVVRAPIDGIVGKRTVEIGQKIQAGQRLMMVTPVNDIYVNANFKETQLRKMAIGQLVKVSSDLYGSRVVYKGRVEGFSPGTGAAFAAIPAQNATGNWIKVVQRVPVRISLAPEDLEKYPLRVGLSMHVVVDLSSEAKEGL